MVYVVVMTQQLYPSDLTDSQWDIIQGLIPPAKPGGRPRSLDMRQVVNAVLYVVVGGAGKKLRRIWVDGSYRGQLLDWVAERFRFWLQPVLRPEEQKGFVLLARRWVVERTFAWFGHYRRLSKDYERQESTSETMVRIAMIRLMLRRLARA
jgi:transposase